MCKRRVSAQQALCTHCTWLGSDQIKHEMCFPRGCSSVNNVLVRLICDLKFVTRSILFSLVWFLYWQQVLFLSFREASWIVIMLTMLRGFHCYLLTHLTYLSHFFLSQFCCCYVINLIKHKMNTICNYFVSAQPIFIIKAYIFTIKNIFYPPIFKTKVGSYQKYCITVIQKTQLAIILLIPINTKCLTIKCTDSGEMSRWPSGSEL